MSFLTLSSKIFGAFANYSFPSFLQERINLSYVNLLKLDMSEFEDYKTYKSLNALFTRSLREKRVLEEGFISPSDGKILDCGTSFKGKDINLAFSIKGFTYSLDELLGQNYKIENKFSYVNIYLSPKDYHRFHSPCDMQILSATYIRGDLYSVSEKKLLQIPNLYTKNERVVLECKAKESVFYLVFVGAQNVGKIHFHFDKNLQAQSTTSPYFTKQYENSSLNKGDELGYFELGSTIVLLTPKEFVSLECKNNQELKFGQKIANLKD